MIFRDKKKEPEVVNVVLRIIRLDENTLTMRLGGSTYHIKAGEFSKALALGTEIVAELVAK